MNNLLPQDREVPIHQFFAARFGVYNLGAKV